MMKRMKKRDKRIAILKTELGALFYFPLVSFVSFISWIRGWKVDPKCTEHNPVLLEERFVKNGIRYYRHGGTTWIVGPVDKCDRIR